MREDQLDLFVEESQKREAFRQLERSCGALIDAAVEIGAAYCVLLGPGGEFTAHDVLQRMKKRPDFEPLLLAAREKNGNRWTGPAMDRLRQLGYVERTAKQRHDRSHKGTSAVWRVLAR